MGYIIAGLLCTVIIIVGLIVILMGYLSLKYIWDNKDSIIKNILDS